MLPMLYQRNSRLHQNDPTHSQQPQVPPIIITTTSSPTSAQATANTSRATSQASTAQSTSTVEIVSTAPGQASRPSIDKQSRHPQIVSRIELGPEFKEVTVDNMGNFSEPLGEDAHSMKAAKIYV